VRIVLDGNLDTLGDLRAVHAGELGEGHVNAGPARPLR
jgi:hypothetical protein